MGFLNTVSIPRANISALTRLDGSAQRSSGELTVPPTRSENKNNQHWSNLGNLQGSSTFLGNHLYAVFYGENSVSLLGTDVFLTAPSDCVTTCPLTAPWEQGWVSSLSHQPNSAPSQHHLEVPTPTLSIPSVGPDWLFPGSCLMLHSLPCGEEAMGTPGRLLPQGRQEGLFPWPLKKYSSDILLRIFQLFCFHLWFQ